MLATFFMTRYLLQGLHLSEEEVARFERYFYHILAARGSGEYALSHLLEPFAWPRAPLEDRLHELKVWAGFCRKGFL